MTKPVNKTQIVQRRTLERSLLTSFFHTLVYTDVQGMLRCGNHVSVMLSRNHLSIEIDEIFRLRYDKLDKFEINAMTKKMQ